MSGFSTYQANAIINSTLVTPYASRYIALFIADPTDANLTANEVSAAWYSRMASGAWASPTNGATSNSNEIQWSPVSGSQVTITHWGVYDAATAGNLLYSFAYDSPKTFNIDDIPVSMPGDLQVVLL